MLRPERGIVAHSSPESELQELNNKLGALMKAVEMSEKVKKLNLWKKY